MLRFLAFGGNIRQDSCWYIHQDESWRILPPNARKRSTGALHRARNAGKRSTGAVLKAKIEIMKKYFVCREGHSKLQKIAFGKISSIFSVLFLDDAFFTKRAVVGEIYVIFGRGIRFRGPKSRTGSPEWSFEPEKLQNPFWRVARFRATEPNSSPKNNVDPPRRRPVSWKTRRREIKRKKC